MHRCIKYRGARYRLASLSDVLRLLLEAGIDFVVTGGLAVEAYVPSRVGADIDVLFDSGDELLQAVQVLMTANHSVQEVEPGYQYELVGVDLLRAIGYEKEAFTRAVKRRVRGMDLPVLSLYDLIAIKIDSGRERDLEDVTLLRTLVGSAANVR